MEVMILTDVYNVPIAIDHDITIMPVFYLQNVTGNGIRRHGLDEVEASLLEFDCVFPSILRNKEIEQIVHFRTTHFISRRGVRDHINHTTLRGISENALRGLRITYSRRRGRDTIGIEI